MMSAGQVRTMGSNPQAEPTTGSTDPQVQLGGNTTTTRLSGPEIAVICATVAVFFIIMFLIFYGKQLQLRRKMAMGIAAEEAQQRATHDPGQGIELKLANGGGNGEGEVGSRGTIASGCNGANPALSGTTKPPLWKFIHWKEPVCIRKCSHVQHLNNLSYFLHAR